MTNVEESSSRSTHEYRARVLGPVTVSVDGTELDLGGPKQRLLLAILLVHVGEVVSADALIDGLWGEDPPVTARKAVQVHVSNLRRALGDDFPLRTAPGGYVVQSGGLDFDAARFEDELDSAKAKLRTDSLGAERLLTDAVARWNGPAYADLDHEPALEAEIVRLDELRLQALETRAEAGLRAGRHADLVGELTTLCAEHTFREKLTELLMLALYRSGRQAEALRAYERLRSVLVEELGVEPGPGPQSLHHQILEQSAELDLDEASIEDRFAFLATDIESSTAMWEADPEAMQEAVARHDEILAEAVAGNAGTVFKGTGDGIYAVFAGAADALQAAVDAQQALFAEPWVTERPLRVRMGVDEGPASARGGDYFGPALNRVSRIMSSGHGGQVLCPVALAGQASTPTRDLGGADYKGVGRLDVAQLDVPGLPHEFPDLETDRAPKTMVREGFGRAIRGYELREQLGEGAHGVVYRAYQAAIGREVAIKVIRPEHANQPEFVKRFEAEAQFVAQLEHPHIVSLYDYWRDPDGAYLVMPLLRGGSLAATLERAPWRPPAAMKLLDQVGVALDYAHRQGVMHHDLKPANVLLDSEGNAYLSDFSIAARHIEAVGVPVGSTVAYLSPEELAGEGAGPAADMYGLALLTYEILTGDRPPLGGQPTPLAEQRPDLPPSIDEILARAAHRDPAKRFDRVDDFLRALRRGFGTDVVSHERRAAPAEIRNPYKGLRAFAETDADDFSGRDELVEELLDHVTSHRLTAVVGPSGSGKSSLVRAGLLPRIRRRAGGGPGTVLVTDMFPGSYPFEELEAALLRVGVAHQDGLLGELAADDRGLLRMSKQLLPDDDSELLLVIDQFEELFLLTHDDEARRRFLANLVTVASDERSRVRLVVTMRADHFDRPLADPEFGALLRTSVVPVSMPTYDELTRAIAQPAAGTGLEFEAGLIPRIVGDVADQPGALPLLQYALTELVGAREGAELTMAGYERIGGVDGALTRRAEEIYAGLGDAARDATREVFLRLVAVDDSGDDTRRRARRSELESLGLSDAALDAALDGFGSFRLLSFDRDPVTRGPTVEVAHEALIREWPRLAGWIDERREDLLLERRLEAASAEWDASGREPSFLFTGGRLDQYEQWAGTAEVRLTALEQDFLDEARRADDEATTRRRRRRRGVMAALGLFALLACGAAAVALAQRNDANRNADRAEDARADTEDARAVAVDAQAAAEAQAYASETGRLVALSSTLAGDDGRVSPLLAVAAHQRDPSPATLGALQESLVRAPVLQHAGWGTDYSEVQWVADNRVVAGRDDGVDLIDLETGIVVDSLPVQLSSDFLRMGTATDAGGTLLAVLGETPRPEAPEFPQANVTTYAVGAEGFEMLFEPVALDAFGMSVAISPSGDRIVASGIDGAESLVLVLAPDGTRLWSQRFPYPANIAEQLVGTPGESHAESPFWRSLPAPVGAWITEDQVFVTNGGFLHRFDHDGVRLGDPIYVHNGPFPHQVFDVTESDAGWTLFGSVSNQRVLLGFVASGDRWPEQLNVAGFGPESASRITARGMGDGLLVSSRADGTLEIVDAANGARESVMTPGVGEPRAVSIDPVRGRLAIAHSRGVAVVPLGDVSPLAHPVPRSSGLTSPMISPDGSVALLGPSPGNVAEARPEVWRIDADGTRLESDTPIPVSALAAYLVPGASSLVATRVPFTPFTNREIGYSLDTGDEWTWDRIPFSSAQQVTLESPHGPLRAVGVVDTPGEDLTVRVYALGDYEHPVHVIEPTGDEPQYIVERDRVSGLAFDPGGARLLVSYNDRPSRLFDVASWTPIDDDEFEERDILRGYWSRDGRLVATSANDGTISIRDGSTFDVIRVLVGSAGDEGFRFSPDGSLLVSTADETLWDVESGARIGVGFPNAATVLAHANADADGLRFITGTEGTALIWNLDTGTWADLACRVAGSNLTAAEWDEWGPSDTDRYAICPQFELP